MVGPIVIPCFSFAFARKTGLCPRVVFLLTVSKRPLYCSSSLNSLCCGFNCSVCFVVVCSSSLLVLVIHGLKWGEGVGRRGGGKMRLCFVIVIFSEYVKN